MIERLQIEPPLAWCPMPGPSAVPVAPSDRQRGLLHRLSHRQTACQRLARRVSVLLALDADPRIGPAARLLGLTRLTVRHWRDRWRAAAPALVSAEQEGANDRRLLALIEQALDDAPGLAVRRRSAPSRSSRSSPSRASRRRGPAGRSATGPHGSWLKRSRNARSSATSPPGPCRGS